jgi:hypothetical protein
MPRSVDGLLAISVLDVSAVLTAVPAVMSAAVRV